MVETMKWYEKTLLVISAAAALIGHDTQLAILVAALVIAYEIRGLRR
jgi:hypothetical protein